MEDNEIFTITYEDGTQMEFTVLCNFQALNRDYVAVIPLDGKNDIHFFRVGEGADADGNEGVILSVLQSDMEFDEVLAVFEASVEDVSE